MTTRHSQHPEISAPVGRVGGLFVHPIKSTAPVAVNELWLDDRGAVGDRVWMLIDNNGVAITARTHSMLALVQCRFTEHSSAIHTPRNVDGPLWVSASGFSDLAVAMPHEGATTRAEVWDDTVNVTDAGDIPAEWFSDVIGASCRLVRVSAHSDRPLQSRFAGPLSSAGREVALSDGAPLLILGQASVDALNDRIAANTDGDSSPHMVVRRFRPNILVVESGAHAEDTWRAVRIGNVDVGVGDACKRCVFTTVDPATGHRGVEPLRTLATYRRHDGHVIFAMNATHASPGVIYLGDPIRPT